MPDISHEDIRQAVRERYGNVATLTSAGCGESTSCCGGTTSCCGESAVATAQDIALALGYSQDEVTAVPEGANMGLGCGNPPALAALQAGETVLDLGSGGGFDCFLAARYVGPTGHVIGVDRRQKCSPKPDAMPPRLAAPPWNFALARLNICP